MNYIKLLSFLFALILISESCTKFVEIDAPSNQLVTSSVFKRDATAIAAVLNIYARIVNDQSFPSAIPVYTGMYSDELKSNSTNVSYLNYYTNNLVAGDNPFTNIWWTKWYNQVYQANAIIEGISASTSLTPAVAKRLTAESKFIRAFSYFYLTNLWGNVPLILTTDYTTNATAPRTAQSAIYNQMATDLTSAAENLDEDYMSANTITTTTERFRPNKYAAMALLARVYLYKGDYANANKYATEVINKSSYYKLEELNTAFLINSKEAIWQLMTPTPYNATGNTLEGNTFILTTKPNLSGIAGSLTISQSLLDAFTAADKRKEKWLGFINDPATSINYYYSFKFKERTSLTPLECTIPLRLAEQFLIRAEARAILGQTSEAKLDLDTIRARAGLSKTTANTSDEIVTAVTNERRLELFTEWGHRFFDLKRKNKIDAVMSTEAVNKGGSWASYKAFWPIPQKELLNNSNLKQTDGYN